MVSRSFLKPTCFAVLASVLSLGPAARASAEEPAPAVEPPAAPAPPTWRFRHPDKTVKVIVVAGSIGAWPDQSYASRLGKLCKNVDVRNLSEVGQGAWALKRKFRDQVVKNPYVRLRDAEFEYWLVYGGGLNSVGTPRSTNKHMHDLFVLAHAHGVKVVALTLTPWGDLGDKRWRGHAGLQRRRHTQAVVDYTLGRSSPRDAFGNIANRRKGGADAPWQPNERPDVAIDLYDSALRDREAQLGDAAVLAEKLARDKAWKQETAGLDEAVRAERLAHDAAQLAELPRWFMRKDLRSFDHTHPNTEGHRIIAHAICPSLPASWGCACEESVEQRE